VFGVTSDFDLHIQNVLPWLPHFDELITVGAEEQAKVARLSGRPVQVFPKMFGLPAKLPPARGGERHTDLYISGTIANPYHPDKAELLQQLLGADLGRIHYVDGFVSPAEYYAQLAQTKVSFTYVRHPSSMPSRGLEALAMGCVVVTQKGSLLTRYAGEEDGVLTYDAGGGALVPMLREALRRYPELGPRALKAAGRIRREFVQSRCISEFLRFLTVRAACAPARSPASREHLRQKRGVLRRGHCHNVATHFFMVGHYLERGEAEARVSRESVPGLDLCRELDLFAAGDLGDALRQVSRSALSRPEKDKRQAGLEADRRRLVGRAGSLYMELVDRHPDSLVTRFNAIRHFLHLGPGEEVPRGLALARETVARPAGCWRIDPLEDVFPWDYHGHLFNYRGYLETVNQGLLAGVDPSERLVKLIGASIRGYLGHHSGDPADFEEAVELDSEFPFYRWFLAERLVRRGAAADLERAAGLLADLVRGSMLVEPAFELLVSLQDRVEIPDLDNLEARIRRLRNMAQASYSGSREYLQVELVPNPEAEGARDGAGVVGSEPAFRSGASLQVSHRVRRPGKAPRILLVPLECANWAHARSWSYTGYFGFEEGLRAAGASFMTLPALAEVPSDHAGSWLRYARRLCSGERFDQVWVWMTHNDYDADFLEWIGQVAPVRVGVVMESMENTAEECARYPRLQGRREGVRRQLRQCTHGLNFDEVDAGRFAAGGGVNGVWWPPLVPWRCVSAEAGVDLSASGPALFGGSLYSAERRAYLDCVALKGRLGRMEPPEDKTDLPRQFDELHREALHQICRNRSAHRSQLDHYLGGLRRIRRQLFDLWLSAVRGGYASANLPSIFKGYAGRVVEAMAVGRPVLSWDVPRPLTRSLFEPDSEILLFPADRPEVLGEQVDRLGRDRALAVEMAERAREKVLRYHTAEVRVRQVLDWLAEGIEPDYGCVVRPKAVCWQAAGRRELGQLGQVMPVAHELGASLDMEERKRRAEKLLESGAAEEALPLLREWVRLEPTGPRPWVLLATAILQAGNSEEFEAVLARALELEPDYPPGLRLMAEFYRQQRRWSDAAQTFVRLLRQLPEDRDGLHGLASCFVQAGEYEAAREVLQAVLEKYPDDSAAADQMAALRNRVDQDRARRGSGRTGMATAGAVGGPVASVAVGAVEKPVLDGPKVAPAASAVDGLAGVGSLERANQLLADEDHAAAWQSVLAAIDERPFHPEGWLWLSRMAAKRGCCGLARQTAERAKALVPSYKPVRQWLKSLPVMERGEVSGWMRLPPVAGRPGGEMKPRLSVCLIVRNEEATLARCLRSIRGVASQIVVVDTGSTDGTVRIAEDHGAEVHRFEWCEDFAAARNAALERARGDWVLVLDADEELPAESLRTLAAELAEPRAMAYRLPIVDAGREHEGANYVPRLFRNAPGVRFKGRIHEHAFASLEPLWSRWGMECLLGKTRIVHHGYVAGAAAARAKAERNLRLLRLALEDEPGEVNLLMNLGLELTRVDRSEEGMQAYREAFEKAAAHPTAISPELRESLLTQWCTRLLGVGKPDEVLVVLQSRLAGTRPLTSSLHYVRGLACLELQRWEEAVKAFQHSLADRSRLGLTPAFPEIHGPELPRALALSLKCLRRHEEAERVLRTAISEHPADAHLVVSLAQVLADQDRAVQAFELLHPALARFSANPVVWATGGRIALSRPEYLEFACDWTGEAVKHCPGVPELAALRGEALLLSGDPAGALGWWLKAEAKARPECRAARIICELSLDPLELGEHRLNGSGEAVAREFLRWYQRLAEFHCQEPLLKVNQRLAQLRGVLPQAAEALEAAMSEAAGDT